MELRQLRYFMAVAEELHFGRAAARIGMAQSPLSRAIREFENDLHVKLFATTTRRTELTVAGATLFQDARRILSAADQAKARVQGLPAGAERVLRIGVCESALFLRFTSLLARFRVVAPTAELRLHELAYAQQLNDLESGLIDLGFCHSPVDSQALETESLCSMSLVAALPANHEFASNISLTLSELVRQPLILSSSFKNGGAQSQIDALIQSCTHKPKIIDAEASFVKLMTSVGAGFGVGLVPDTLAELMNRSDIVFRPLSSKRARLTTYLIRRREVPSVLMARFIAEAKALSCPFPPS